MYVIYKIPSLRVLDFQKVKQKEREHAKKLFETEQSAKAILKEISQRQ